MLKPVSRRIFIRKLLKLGFDGPFTGGRHQFLKRNGLNIVIPNPHGKDISANLLRKILQDAEISVDDFINA